MSGTSSESAGERAAAPLTSAPVDAARFTSARGRFSVRWKIALLVALVVTTIAGLDAFLVPEAAARAEQQALEQRAQAAAAMLADVGSITAAVGFEQSDTAHEALSAALGDSLVKWAAIYTPDGRLFTQVGVGAPPRYRSDQPLLLPGASLAIGRSPIRSRDDQALGQVAVAIRTTAVNERRQASRVAIIVQGTLVGVLGVVLAVLLSAPMVRSMSMMAAAAERIAHGDVQSELAVAPTKDELGDMALSFERMNGRLRDLQRGAQKVANGDLTVSIAGDGELFVAFRQMVENLRDLAERMGQSSGSVSSAAAGMFSAVREQEALATQQTASLEEIRRTLETLAVSAEAVADDATAVREMSVRTLESSKRMAEHTRLVSAHSDRIGEILSLIQDIADRSDLLALNAALEGTKAGEVGRGFSLVAAEMRRLSEHVMDSVRDIRKLVADMRSASHSSVLATEESTKLANEAASASAKISDAVARQREGTAQAKTAADEVVRAVNESLAGSAQTTASAESLLQLSHELKNTVRVFRIGLDVG